MSKFKIIEIKEDHYKAHLSWFFGDEKDFFDVIKKNGFTEEPKLGGDGHSLCFDKYKVIWVNHKLKPDDFLRALCHELLHYVIMTLELKGVVISAENDEAITYFFEKMLKKCMEVDLKKIIKRLNR